MVIRMDVIVAIDPGARSGWAVLSVEPNPKLLLSDSVAWPKPGTKKDLPANTVSAVVDSLLDTLRRFEHTVVGVGIEDQFLGVNPQSMKKLVRNGGRWEEAWRRHGYEVEWVYPQKWQTAELGTARIDRSEVKRRCKVKSLNLWGKKLKEDESDAAMIGRYLAIRCAYRRLRQQ